jgi:hypothetical protein
MRPPQTGEYTGGSAPIRALRKQYELVGQKIEAYAKQPSLPRLIALHDSIEMFRAKHHYRERHKMSFVHSGNKMLCAGQSAKIRYFLNKTGALDKNKLPWKNADMENVWISSDDAEHLLRLVSEETEGHMEYSGGAKIVKRENKFWIRPIYSTVSKFHSTAPVQYAQLIKSGAHLMWHTHPISPGYSQTLSEGDRQFSHHFPLMLTGIKQIGDVKKEWHGNRVANTHFWNVAPVFQIGIDGKVVDVKVNLSKGSRKLLKAVAARK